MPSKITRAIAGSLAAGILAMSLTGCLGDKNTEPFRDSPRTAQTNTGPAEVIEMPDGFNNLATKCDNGNRVYVTYHDNGAYGAVAVVPNAKGC